MNIYIYIYIYINIHIYVHIYAYSKFRVSARTLGSIFELLLSESLEDLIAIHTKKGFKSLRKNEHWDDIYRDNIDEELYRCIYIYICIYI
jgi:hypothetical protein